MKDSIYFSHDSNARRDPKMLKIRAKYKNEGYALYFMILEIMREQEGYKLHTEEWTSDVLASELNISVELTEEFITDCIIFKLFKEEEEFIWSESLLERMEIMNRKATEKSNQNRENALNGWKKRREGNAPAKQTERREPKPVSEKVDITKEFPMFSNSEFVESWNAFSKMRKDRKKPMTDRAAKTILTDLSKHPIKTAIAMLDKSERNSWADVYPLKEQDFSQKNASQDNKLKGNILDKIAKQNER